MAPWALLALAFLAFGIWVRFQMPVPIGTVRDTEIYSFDYLGYADTFCDYRAIGYGRFRHPLWGWLTSPIALFGHRIYELNEWAFWVFVLSIFSLVMVGCVALLFRLLRRRVGLSPLETGATTALFLSFAHVWLLAGMPETYGPSMLLSLAALTWAMGSAERQKMGSIRLLGERIVSENVGRRIDMLGWCALGVLMGGVTITQGAKTTLAFLATHRPSRRQLVLGALGGCVAVALVVLVFYVRLRIRTSGDASAPGLERAWHTLVDNFAPLALPFKERLRYVWVFFSEPVLLRGEPFDERMIAGGYPSFLHVLLLCMLYAVAAISAWLNRHALLVRIMGAMFLVDVAIHFVAGWGLMESHLYAGHWFYILPLLAGMLAARLPADWRSRYFVLLGFLALANIACNIYGYFGHDVGLEWGTEN